MNTLTGRHKIIIFLIFCLSGFSALVYEVLWTKQLSLAFGSTMTAVSIVAATFMAGLALGSFLLGKTSDQQKNLLRIYAYLEMGIAGFALLFPQTLKFANASHIALQQLFPTLGSLTDFAHLGVSAILLIPPTLFMGGTFPIMCRYFARRKSGGQIGRLYAINTLGAAAGASLCGYVLIPQLGLFATNLIAVTINLVSAAVAWQFSRTVSQPVPEKPMAPPGERRQPLIREYRPVLIASALIGFFTLAYEILWTRVFMLFIGNTSFAFALILSSFLVSIALGGALYARIIHSEFNERKLFIRLTFLMGLSVLLTVPFYDQLAYVFQWAHGISSERWGLLTLLSGMIVFVTICIPIVISGCLLPAAFAILDPGQQRTGEGVGLVVLYNTIGAVLGSLVAGFFLVPALGIQGSFQALAGINILLSGILCLAFFDASMKRVLQVPLACAIAFVLILASPAWDQALMNSGVYIYASKYRRAGGLDKVLAEERIIKVIEGAETTVAVHESLDGQARFFTVNGKTDGSSSRDMATQVLVGHLPMLLHPAPHDVLVIGLGTGVTLRGLSGHPVERIKCVEISPEVVEAAHYFRDANEKAIADPKISLLIEDGRHLLLEEDKRYDVIVSEPSNPWQSGNANLFTDDFYQLAASRLKPDGVFAQWIGIYDITPDNLRVAINTLLKTFPEALAFRTGSDLIIVGAQHELKFDYLGLQQRMTRPGVQETLHAIDIDSPGDLITSHYLVSENSLKEFCDGAPLNTDDLPILEYSAKDLLARNNISSLQMENINALKEARGRIALPLTNLGRDIPTIVQSLRELGSQFSAAGWTKEAQLLLRRARELQTQSTQSS